MISLYMADITVAISLALSLLAYWRVARYENSFLHIMAPDYLVSIPASYILPTIFVHLFGTEASPYSFTYVYAAMAVENLAFALSYTRMGKKKILSLPLSFSYRNFTVLAFVFLVLAFLVYLPILLEFPQFLLDPRQIYIHTRTGYGGYFFVSTALAYVSVIFILFSKRSLFVKGMVILSCAIIVTLHGSKGAALSLLFLIGLYGIYVRGWRVRLLPAVLASLGIAVVGIGLFAATMSLGESGIEAIEGVAQYSDYTRNAMLVIDQHFPTQYGRIALEGNFYAVVPRALMPDKPKDFGPIRLDEEYYPETLDLDQGAPGFGVGVQYADFGAFAIVYLALFGAFRGWLGRIFVNRLRVTKHPGDFVMVCFLGGVGLLTVGAGWLLPETLAIVFLLRFLSTAGVGPNYREAIGIKPRPSSSLAISGTNPA